jgi:hypothetical protein
VLEPARAEPAVTGVREIPAGRGIFPSRVPKNRQFHRKRRGTKPAFRRANPETVEVIMPRYPTLHAVLVGAARVAVRTGAIAIGVPMMVLGLAMGVSLVMLPAGLVIGLLGLLIALWAMFGDLTMPARV